MQLMMQQVRSRTESHIDFLISTFLLNCYAGNINDSGEKTCFNKSRSISVTC